MTTPTAVGIDLGTTFSVVAQVDEMGVPRVIPNLEGAATTPSAVLFDGNRAIVGSLAREALASEAEFVVQLVKRHIGSQWSFDYKGISYRPEHVSALILRKLRSDAEATIGPITQAVVTVPAYFNDSMRLATRQAAELAGLEVLGLLSEPTAAAISYGYKERPVGTTGVVVDLGGGTFDITVLRFEGEQLQVLATGGDHYLGGANFDKALFDNFVEQFIQRTGFDINDPSSLSIDEYTHVTQDWLLRANRAKHDLSLRERTTVPLQAGGMNARLEISRDQFQAMTRVLVSEIEEKIVDVVAAAGLTNDQIDLVLSVGGSTRVPVVREAIERILNKQVDMSVRPDEAVALGAALFAAQRQLEMGSAVVMEKNASDYLSRLVVQDVASHSLGVRALETVNATQRRAIMAPIVTRNSALPVTQSRTFYTVRANETQVVLKVLEGESSDPDLCKEIGEVRVQDLPTGRPAAQEVIVDMTLNRDGILEVRATDAATGASAITSIEHTYGSVELGDAVADAMASLTVE